MLGKTFKKEDGGIEAAERAYGMTISTYMGESPSEDDDDPTPLPDTPELKRRGSTLYSVTKRPRMCDSATETMADTKEATMPTTTDGKLALLYDVYNSLNQNEQSEVNDNLFLKLAQANGIADNPNNFASLSVEAMKRLKDADKPNLIHRFSRCIGEDRPMTSEQRDGDPDALEPDPLMPFHQCPLA